MKLIELSTHIKKQATFDYKKEISLEEEELISFQEMI